MCAPRLLSFLARFGPRMPERARSWPSRGRALDVTTTRPGFRTHRRGSQRSPRLLAWSSVASTACGEVVKVDLFLRLSGPKNFVVVDDPVPGGLEPVNRDLATSSQRDAAAGAFVGSGGSFWFTANDWVDYGQAFWSFYHKELRNSAARFYSSYLPAGNYHLSYTAQAIASGEFVALPARAEEMYDPDSFGLSAGDRLVVSPGAGGR